MRPARRRCWQAALLGLAPVAWPWHAARAQADWQRNAVPVVAPAAWADSVWRHHALPLARAFEAAARRLHAALQARADGNDAGGAGAAAAARQAWTGTLQAWAALAAVALGPLVQRRTVRRVDFVPVRPPLLLRAVQRLAAEPALAADVVGGPAKGLGALEWLLWSRAAPQDGAARRYAAFVAADIAAEAQAVLQGFEDGLQAQHGETAEAAESAAAEVLNQWIGGLEALRLGAFEKPLAERRQRGAAAWPRALSGTAGLERQARWASLQALAVFAAGAVAGQGLVPLETLLRGRGLNPLADRLVQATTAAAAALAAVGVRADPGATPAPVAARAAARALAALKHLAEAEVAPALDVAVGFSDADGD